MALLEFKTVAAGVLASDRMVKRAPIALLRCGTIHPGRFLILVGGSVASTEEAFLLGAELGEAEGTLAGSVFLGDVHPNLHDAVLGGRRGLEGDALAVVETRSSPALLAAVLLALDPFYLAHSRVIHHDALATTFSIIALVAFLGGDIFMADTIGRYNRSVACRS